MVQSRAALRWQFSFRFTKHVFFSENIMQPLSSAQRASVERHMHLVDLAIGLAPRAASVLDRDDLRQELYLVLMKSVQTCPEGTSLGGWAVSAMRYQAMELARNELKHRGREQEPLGELDVAPEPGEVPDFGLHILSDRERLIVERLFGLAGEPQTLEQVAGDANCTRQTVAKDRDRALEKLRKYMEE